MLLVNSTSGDVMVEAEEPAGFLARMRGLLGTSSIPDGRGLLLSGRQVHTFGMRFAIDAVYLSRDLSVIRIATLPPNRLGPFERTAKWVLELGRGEASRLGMREGLSLAIRR